MLNRKRAVPLKPTPPPFRNHGNYVVSRGRAQPLAGGEGRGGRRLRPLGDDGHKLLGRAKRDEARSRRGAVVGVRTGDKGRDKSGAEKGNFEPGSDVIAQGHRAGRGLLGAPDRRGDEVARAGRLRPPGVGARRQGGVGGRAAVREDRPHARLAAARPREVEGVRRLLDLRHEPRGRAAAGVDRLRHRPGLHGRPLLGPRRAAGVQAPPARPQDPGRGQARGLGREGDPRGRLLGDAHAARAGDGHLRRRRRDGQRPEAQGHPLRDRVRPAGGGDDLPAAQERLERTSRSTSPPSTSRTSAPTCASRAT